MIINKQKKVALLHVARRQCGLDDTAYRALLDGAAGIDSARDLEHEDQFRQVMEAFRALGFKSRHPQGKGARPTWGDRWACSDSKRAKIEVLWKQVAKNPSARALQAFIARVAQVDHPRWLDDSRARKVILALAAMMRRAGLDPATGARLETKTEAQDGQG